MVANCSAVVVSSHYVSLSPGLGFQWVVGGADVCCSKTWRRLGEVFATGFSGLCVLLCVLVASREYRGGFLLITVFLIFLPPPPFPSSQVLSYPERMVQVG